MERYPVLKRTAAYLLISLSLALALGPFTLDAGPVMGGAAPAGGEIIAGTRFTLLRFSASALLFVPGIFYLLKCYRRPPGIAVSPRWFPPVADAIAILFLAAAAYGVWSWGFDWLLSLRTEFYAGDPLALQVMALFFLPTAFILAFFISNLGGQSVEIDKEGMTLYYPGEIFSLPWDAIRSLGTRESFTFTGGEEWAAPRELQNKLVITTAEERHELYEPGLRRTKEAIVEKLRKYAPPRLQNEIETVAKEW